MAGNMSMDNSMTRFFTTRWYVGCNDGGHDASHNGSHFEEVMKI